MTRCFVSRVTALFAAVLAGTGAFTPFRLTPHLKSALRSPVECAQHGALPQAFHQEAEATYTVTTGYDDTRRPFKRRRLWEFVKLEDDDPFWKELRKKVYDGVSEPRELERYISCGTRAHDDPTEPF